MRVGPSKLCERGVFATQPYEAGEIIERCPFIEVLAKEVAGLIDYVYEGSEDSTVVFVFGYGMLYNHDSPGNITYHLCEDSGQFIFSAITAIVEGDELTHDYGEEWWSSRGLRPTQDSSYAINTPKQCPDLPGLDMYARFFSWLNMCFRVLSQQIRRWVGQSQ